MSEDETVDMKDTSKNKRHKKTKFNVKDVSYFKRHTES